MAKTLGKYLRECRLRKGLTLRELARRAGVDPATIHNLENDKKGLRPRDETLRRIAEALDPTSLNEFFVRAGRIPPDLEHVLLRSLNDALNEEERDREVPSFLRSRARKVSPEDWDRLAPYVKKNLKPPKGRKS